MKKIFIDGMSCGNCVNHVQNALNALEDTSVIEIELKGKYALVDTKADNRTLTDIIEEEGYEVTDIKEI